MHARMASDVACIPSPCVCSVSCMCVMVWVVAWRVMLGAQWCGSATAAWTFPITHTIGKHQQRNTTQNK